MKDRVTHKLRLAIEQSTESRIKSSIEVMQEIRQRKLHTPTEVAAMIESANQARKSG